MYALLSGLAKALVTNSALIVNWTHVDKYIKPPLFKCFQLNYTGNELSFSFKENETWTYPRDSSNTYKVAKNLAEFYRDNPPQGVTRLRFNEITAFFFEFGCNIKYYSTFLDYGLVAKETLQRAAQVLNVSRIVSNNETIDIAYRVGFELAHNILNLFWLPKTSLQQTIDSYVKQNFTGNFVIGMQLRYHYLTWEDSYVVFNCAKDLEANTKTKKPIKWFISSDNEAYIERIRQLFPGKVINANGSVTHINDDAKGYFRALLDLELLSQCDEYIMTGGSTFGFMASLRSGKYPYFVNGRFDSKKCQLFSFSNPSQTSIRDALF
jgi:hypothetical protein